MKVTLERVCKRQMRPSLLRRLAASGNIDYDPRQVDDQNKTGGFVTERLRFTVEVL